MNELLRLLQENNLMMTGKLDDNGRIICVIMEQTPPVTDKGPCSCSMIIWEEYSKKPITELIDTFFKPAILSINRNREKLQASI